MFNYSKMLFMRLFIQAKARGLHFLWLSTKFIASQPFIDLHRFSASDYLT